MSGHIPTKHFYIFDGTWGDRNSPGKPTILGSLVDLVRGRGREIRYFRGLGTRSGLVEKYIGGGIGQGIETQIIEAIDHLVTNYSPGDELIFIGYSRGAHAARSVVGFLDRLGVPECNRDVLLELYEKYTSGRLLDRGVADYLREKYRCGPVSVKALICIDTVGSLGIPHTGIFGLLKVLSPFIKKREFMETNVASNVEKICHALALHEYRGPFKPTLMHTPTSRSDALKQVWFLGSHSNMGRDKETGSLADIVLAWLLQQLHDIPGMTFNTERLRVRFPRSTRSHRPISDADGHDWVHDPVKCSKTGVWRLMGTTTRQPGEYFQDGRVTNESIHPTVRMRNYGVRVGDPVIQGYSYRPRRNGPDFWERDGGRTETGSSGDLNRPLRIREEPLGAFEAMLLGIALE